MPNAIELEGVTKTFGKNRAVDALDLQVPEGAIYGFIGPNGSGKTTTLRMILRIFQPDSGCVRVLGEDHGRVADDRLGYLPEERGLYKRMKVRDLLSYYGRLKGHYDCGPEIDRWLEQLEATEWSNRRIDALSKGMAQKVQFIAAVIAKPQLLILDEPFSGLDPVNMESLKSAVMSMRESGTTIVFSTHDMDMAERLCDTIFMIFKGQKVLDGTLDQIQAAYPANRARVRLRNPGDTVPMLQGISDISREGAFHEFTIADHASAQEVLQQLADAVELTHFEIKKPSLHDIFVQIAGPTAAELIGAE